MQKTFLSFIGAILVVLALTASAPARQAAKPMRIGDYSIAPYGTLKIVLQKNGDYDATLVGEKNAPIVAKSPEYTITAPRMEIGLKNIMATVDGKQVRRLKATRIVSTGSTKIVKFNAETNQKTVITCSEMRYSAAAEIADRGVMRLLGNVRSETTDSRLAEPLIATGDTGTATFNKDGTILLTMEATGGNGSLSGKVYEPAPKGKKP